MYVVQVCSQILRQTKMPREVLPRKGIFESVTEKSKYKCNKGASRDLRGVALNGD